MESSAAHPQKRSLLGATKALELLSEALDCEDLAGGIKAQNPLEPQVLPVHGSHHSEVSPAPESVLRLQLVGSWMLAVLRSGSVKLPPARLQYSRKVQPCVRGLRLVWWCCYQMPEPSSRLHGYWHCCLVSERCRLALLVVGGSFHQ
jgi:hypothetical protein